MQNQQVLDIISNLKGRRNYEEKKSKKLGYNTLYEYFEDKISADAKIKEQKEKDLYNKKNLALNPQVQKEKSCSCC